MDITFNAESVEIERAGYGEVTVTAKLDNDDEGVLDNFNISDVVAHFGITQILDHIGESEVREHFGIEEE